MQTVSIDYYRVGQQPVVILRDPVNEHAVQAWRPHIGLTDLVRDDRYLAEIFDHGESDVRKISAEDFSQFCTRHQIPVPHQSFFNSSEVLSGATQRMIHPEILPDFLRAADGIIAAPTRAAFIKSLFSRLLGKNPKVECN